MYQQYVHKEQAPGEQCSGYLGGTTCGKPGSCVPYRSLAKYWTTWVRIWWEKHLEIAVQSWVFAPQMIAQIAPQMIALYSARLRQLLPFWDDLMLINAVLCRN
jgi:hypothetical protein